MIDGSADLRRVDPFWLDIDNCGDSEYMIPAGSSAESRAFNVTEAWDGDVVALGGHLHDDGVKIRAHEQGEEGRLCRSRARYGTEPSYMGHIEAVSGCVGRSLGSLEVGDRVQLDAFYDSPTMQHDVMGIMVGYVADD